MLSFVVLVLSRLTGLNSSWSNSPDLDNCEVATLETSQFLTHEGWRAELACSGTLDALVIPMRRRYSHTRLLLEAAVRGRTALDL